VNKVEYGREGERANHLRHAFRESRGGGVFKYLLDHDSYKEIDIVDRRVQSGKGGADLGRSPKISKALQSLQPKVRSVVIEGAHALCTFIFDRAHRDVTQVGRRVPRRQRSSASAVQGACNATDAMRAECGGVPKQVSKGDLSATTKVKRISNERVPAVQVIKLQIYLGHGG